LPTPPPPPPGAPRPHSYHVVPILITFFGGILLAFGSCVAFLSAININGSGGSWNTLSAIYGAGFFGGVIAALAGIMWAITAVIMFLIHLASDEP
jgi:hypothetical protein